MPPIDVSLVGILMCQICALSSISVDVYQLTVATEIIDLHPLGDSLVDFLSLIPFATVRDRSEFYLDSILWGWKMLMIAVPFGLSLLSISVMLSNSARVALLCVNGMVLVLLNILLVEMDQNHIGRLLYYRMTDILLALSGFAFLIAKISINPLPLVILSSLVGIQTGFQSLKAVSSPGCEYLEETAFSITSYMLNSPHPMPHMWHLNTLPLSVNRLVGSFIHSLETPMFIPMFSSLLDSFTVGSFDQTNYIHSLRKQKIYDIGLLYKVSTVFKILGMLRTLVQIILVNNNWSPLVLLALQFGSIHPHVLSYLSRENQTPSIHNECITGGKLTSNRKKLDRKSDFRNNINVDHANTNQTSQITTFTILAVSIIILILTVSTFCINSDPLLLLMQQVIFRRDIYKYILSRNSVVFVFCLYFPGILYGVYRSKNETICDDIKGSRKGRKLCNLTGCLALAWFYGAFVDELAFTDQTIPEGILSRFSLRRESVNQNDKPNFGLEHSEFSRTQIGGYFIPRKLKSLIDPVELRIGKGATISGEMPRFLAFTFPRIDHAMFRAFLSNDFSVMQMPLIQMYISEIHVYSKFSKIVPTPFEDPDVEVYITASRFELTKRRTDHLWFRVKDSVDLLSFDTKEGRESTKLDQNVAEKNHSKYFSSSVDITTEGDSTWREIISNVIRFITSRSVEIVYGCMTTRFLLVLMLL